MKAVVLDGYTLVAEDLSWASLQEICDEVAVYDATSPDKLLERARGADIILTNKVILGDAEFEKLPKCKYVGVLATGYNVVDVQNAKKRGIVVANIPSYSADSVAQLVFSFILHFSFHVAEHSNEVHKGAWCASKHFCYHTFPLQEIAGKTLGVAGFGDIGSRVARIGLAFGMNVVFYNRSKKDLSSFASNSAIRQVEKTEMLKVSDFLSLCLPLNEESKNFIDETAIKQMKKNAYIINTGRGGLIDEVAMAKALKEGMIQGYATDVLSCEPPRKDCPLLNTKAVITPHIAWQTYEARARLLDIAIANIKAFLSGNPINVVSK